MKIKINEERVRWLNQASVYDMIRMQHFVVVLQSHKHTRPIYLTGSYTRATHANPATQYRLNNLPSVLYIFSFS